MTVDFGGRGGFYEVGEDIQVGDFVVIDRADGRAYKWTYVEDTRHRAVGIVCCEPDRIYDTQFNVRMSL